MPESSITDEITRLSGCRNDILSAISTKGVTVPVGSVLSSCPSLIASIPTGGGGGDPTSMINSGFVGTGAITYVRPFTATQKEVPVYDTVTSAITCATQTTQDLPYNIKVDGSSWFVLNGSSPNNLRFTATKASWASIPGTGNVYMSIGTSYYNGSSVGTWEIIGSSNSNFTAEASFTALSNSNTEYLLMVGMPGWSVTAGTSVTGTTNVQTGTDIPYPQYPTATQGNASSYLSATESWGGGNGYYNPQFAMSGYNSVIYTDGPTTSSTLNSLVSLTLFSSFTTSKNISSMLTSRIATSEDAGYNYSYGAIASSYAGYTGA